MAKLEEGLNGLRPDTVAIHGGQRPEPVTGAMTQPIFQTTTYAQNGPGEHTGFEYARTQNPTRFALERAMAALEGGTYGLCYGSGLAAVTTVLQTLSAGDHVVTGNDLYGGTGRLFEKIFTRLGLTFSFVDTRDLDAFRDAFRPETQLVWLETPTNPMLRLTDLAGAAEITHAKGAKLCVDNTFLSPIFQRPLDLGADLVMHSTTKYIGGHSDSLGGVLVTDDEAFHDRLQFLQNASGAVPGPQDCYLTLRGIKTLPLRMARHGSNAQAVAEMLAEHPKVQDVIYPGLPSHPAHDLAKRQQLGMGGMVTFRPEGGLDAVRRFLKALELVHLAESLGAVESLVCIPIFMTHGSVPPERRKELGITDDLVRLSIGIEHPDDLLADLRQALDAV
jgi:cystathionine gamma-lyase